MLSVNEVCMMARLSGTRGYGGTEETWLECRICSLGGRARVHLVPILHLFEGG